MIPSSWQINKVFTKVSKVLNFLNILHNVLEFSFYWKWLCSTFVCFSSVVFWVVRSISVRARSHIIDLISPWCYFLPSLSSTILLNNSSQQGKKWWNNTRSHKNRWEKPNTRPLRREAVTSFVHCQTASVTQGAV